MAPPLQFCCAPCNGATPELLRRLGATFRAALQKIVKFMPPDYLLDDCEPVVSRQAKTNADLVNLVIDQYAALDDCNADKRALRAYRRSLDMDHGQE